MQNQDAVLFPASKTLINAVAKSTAHHVEALARRSAPAASVYESPESWLTDRMDGASYRRVEPGS